MNGYRVAWQLPRESKRLRVTDEVLMAMDSYEHHFGRPPTHLYVHPEDRGLYNGVADLEILVRDKIGRRIFHVGTEPKTEAAQAAPVEHAA